MKQSTVLRDEQEMGEIRQKAKTLHWGKRPLAGQCYDSYVESHLSEPFQEFDAKCKRIDMNRIDLIAIGDRNPRRLTAEYCPLNVAEPVVEFAFNALRSRIGTG